MSLNIFGSWRSLPGVFSPNLAYLAYLAYRRSEEIVWRALDMYDPFLCYDFSTGMVYNVSGAVFPGHFSRLYGLLNSFSRDGFP